MFQVPFGQNVSLSCEQSGKPLRGRATANFSFVREATKNFSFLKLYLSYFKTLSHLKNHFFAASLRRRNFLSHNILNKDIMSVYKCFERELNKIQYVHKVLTILT